ncbi:phage protease [Palleronia sp.]|uniref:phage protease n=1 Tax=Palleronia sp. TaxID=1940284 RepID=UPI0035C803C3
MHDTVRLSTGEHLNGAPEWVHLLPPGVIEARDGRTFDATDSATIVAAFSAGGIDLPVDYEHQNDAPKGRVSGRVPPAGWITELKQRSNGLWGRVEWTERARILIAARKHRFLSPTIITEKGSGRIVRLKSAALVTTLPFASPPLHGRPSS